MIPLFRWAHVESHEVVAVRLLFWDEQLCDWLVGAGFCGGDLEAGTWYDGVSALSCLPRFFALCLGGCVVDEVHGEREKQ